jgi:phosphate starvation-inducible PhoH-like protein
MSKSKRRVNTDKVEGASENLDAKNLKVPDASLKVSQRPKIPYTLSLKQRNDLTEKQKNIFEIAENKNTKCVFIDGLYGTSKSYIAVMSALKLLNAKKVDEIIFIRNPVESSTTGKIGFIPGTSEEKMAPYNAILFDKLEEMLSESDVAKLKKDNRINCHPVGFVRGRSWNCKAVIVDEASSMTWDDLFLVLTRCGEFTRIFFIGDSVNQNDIGAKSGFRRMFDLFNDQESKDFGIHCFELREYSDIVRSGLLRFVMEKTGLIKNPNNDDVNGRLPRKEPMFLEK